MEPNNKVISMFNMDEVKKQINNCPPDEIVILCPHWSINGPKYTIDEHIDDMPYWDMYDMEDFLECCIMVNQFDDLIADPHGIMID